MANYAGAGTTAAGTGAGVLPVTGITETTNIWFWVIVFVLISGGFAVGRLIPKKNTDDA